MSDRLTQLQDTVNLVSGVHHIWKLNKKAEISLPFEWFLSSTASRTLL